MESTQHFIRINGRDDFFLLSGRHRAQYQPPISDRSVLSRLNILRDDHGRKQVRLCRSSSSTGRTPLLQVTYNLSLEGDKSGPSKRCSFFTFVGVALDSTDHTSPASRVQLKLGGATHRMTCTR